MRLSLPQGPLPDAQATATRILPGSSQRRSGLLGPFRMLGSPCLGFRSQSSCSDLKVSLYFRLQFGESSWGKERGLSVAGLRGPPSSLCSQAVHSPYSVSPGSSPSEAWDMKNLHALKWPVDLSPTPWSGSHQLFHGTQSTLIQLAKCPLPPRDQGEARASSRGARGVVSVPGNLVWEGGIYRLLFTKKKQARKTFNSSQLLGTAAVLYLPHPQAPTPCPAAPAQASWLLSSLQELSLIWLTSAADVSTHTRPTG